MKIIQMNNYNYLEGDVPLLAQKSSGKSTKINGTGF